MSDAGRKYDAQKVADLAKKVIDALDGAYDRVEVAGSVRRGNKLVGDLELVIIPKVGTLPGNGLFNEPGSLLDARLKELVREGRLIDDNCNGARQKRFVLPVKSGLKIDFFITMPPSWGYQLAIRTGPREVSRNMVMQTHKGGWLNDRCICDGGVVWRSLTLNGVPVETNDMPAGGQYRDFGGLAYEAISVPEEEDFFKLLAIPYTPPDKRARLA